MNFSEVLWRDLTVSKLFFFCKTKAGQAAPPIVCCYANGKMCKLIFPAHQPTNDFYAPLDLASKFFVSLSIKYKERWVFLGLTVVTICGNNVQTDWTLWFQLFDGVGDGLRLVVVQTVESVDYHAVAYLLFRFHRLIEEVVIVGKWLGG
jgi:hypothetical protein